MFGMSWADTFRVLLMGLFILVCIAITIVVLMQESKQTGLSGAISGHSEHVNLSLFFCPNLHKKNKKKNI